MAFFISLNIKVMGPGGQSADDPVAVKDSKRIIDKKYFQLPVDWLFQIRHILNDIYEP